VVVGGYFIPTLLQIEINRSQPSAILYSDPIDAQSIEAGSTGEEGVRVRKRPGLASSPVISRVHAFTGGAGSIRAARGESVTRDRSEPIVAHPDG
jgi:hypothetical protein